MSGTENQISDSELLRFAIESGMIDRTTIEHQIEMTNKQKLLAEHNLSVWQGKNGMWYTHIIDENGKRRLIKKKTREQVEEVICKHYAEDKPTVNKIFNLWVEEKLHYGEIQKSTYDRYVADFHRFFDDTDLKYKKIKYVTELEIETHIKDQILKHQLTSKAYSGLRTIIIGIFSYAYKYKYCDIAIRTFFNEMRLSSKLFAHKSFLPEDNVFMEDEVKMIVEYLDRHKPNVISYGIMLALRTGLRVGELCSLKYDDIKGNCIRINKTEIRYKVEDGRYTRDVKNNAKTEAGNRCVLIDKQSEELIEKIKNLNPDGDYLFEINGKRCIGQSFTRKLERACHTLGLNPRSMHKCRKTYATNLINAKVPESLIVAQMGHIDISTTKQYYLYNNTAKSEAVKLLSDAIA